MGARIALFNRRIVSGEPVADIDVTYAELVATEVGPADVPRMVDELPLFALAAGMARGVSRVRGARRAAPQGDGSDRDGGRSASCARRPRRGDHRRLSRPRGADEPEVGR